MTTVLTRFSRTDTVHTRGQTDQQHGGRRNGHGRGDGGGADLQTGLGHLQDTEQTEQQAGVW